MKQNSAVALYRFVEALRDISVQQRISYVVMVFLLTLSAWIGGRMLWQPWSTPTVAQWQAGSVASGAESAAQIDISELQNSHLFGKHQTDAPVVEQPKVQDAPKSRLNVVLVGVVTSSNPAKSLAVIANRGQQVTYGIDEVIEGTRAKLIQVQSDRVIIDNSGRNETVMLDGTKYSKPSVAPTQAASEQTTSSQVALDSIASIREEIRQDARQIFQYVRMSQVKQDGEVVGYRLSPGKNSVLFDAVGLQSGDIAVSINGLDLKDSETMGEVFRSLSQLTELNLTVERDGQPHQIYIEL